MSPAHSGQNTTRMGGVSLQPAKKHESVTIVMVPFDQYSSFPQAVDALLKGTRPPFELILIEGNAPDSVRLKLEEKKKRHKNIKIIYSGHRPRLAEAFNLALAHVRTEKVFFTHNNMRVTPHWLDGLLRHAKEKEGVLCPYVSYADDPQPNRGLEVGIHGFLMTRDILKRLVNFDEKVALPLMGLELGQWLKKHAVPVHHEAYPVLEYEAPKSYKSFDIKYLQHQMEERHFQESVWYMRDKWGLKISEPRYVDWLQKKRSAAQRKPSVLSTGWEELPLHLSSPKISLRKFLQVLTKA